MKKLIILFLAISTLGWGQNQRTRDLQEQATYNSGYWVVVDDNGFPRARKMSLNILTGNERALRYVAQDSVKVYVGLESNFTFAGLPTSTYLTQAQFTSAGYLRSIANGLLLLDEAVSGIFDGNCHNYTADTVFSCTGIVTFTDRIKVDTSLSVGVNTVTGSQSGAVGLGNVVSANRSFAVGIEDSITAVNSFSAGLGNKVSGTQGVAFGFRNDVRGANSFIGGGRENVTTSNGIRSAIAGGTLNEISSIRAFIGGGESINVSGDRSGAVGGRLNSITDSVSFIGGGTSNSVSGYRSGIMGGSFDTISGHHSFIGGGQNNKMTGNYSFIGGGISNTASNTYTCVLSSTSSIVSSAYATIIASQSCTVSNSNSAIIGGTLNTVSGIGSAIIGGTSKTLSANNTVLVPNLVVDNSLQFTAGTTVTGSTATVNVAGRSILYVNAGSSTTIGGFSGGVAGQILHIVCTSATHNTTLANNGAGTEKILTNTGSDIVIDTLGGATLIFNGTSWYVIGVAL